VSKTSQAEAQQSPSSELQSFDIGLRDGMLDPKHVRNMGSAVWLYMWLVRKMTRIDETKRLGYVLGGKPITYEEIDADLGISHRTYDRYVNVLRNHGYIVTNRTPRGLVIAITKAKKSFFVGQKGYANNDASLRSDTPEMTHHKASDAPKVAERYATTGASNIREGNENNTHARVFEKLKAIIQPKAEYSEAYGKLVKKALKTYSEDELIVSALFFVGQFEKDTWRDKGNKTIAQFLGNDKNHLPRYKLCFEKAQEAAGSAQRITVVSDEEVEAKHQAMQAQMDERNAKLRAMQLQQVGGVA
jgi:DNA-binding transcriptional ArsR family regulator